MKVNVGHFRQETSDGGFIDFAVFDARTESGTEKDNLELLNNLIRATVQLKNLKIDRAALVFKRDGEIRFYGSKDLVDFLSKHGFPKWNVVLELPDP
jgi:curli biogenesis system outer membrane secretion channel CsgG